ncbi:MAG: PBP1A family penicillin-binding protein [Candidatus Acidiferrales bacterium]
MKIRVSRGFWTSIWGLSLLGLAGAVFLTGFGIFTYYWIHYAHMIDARLSGQIYQSSARVYAAPEPIAEGETLTAAELIAHLERSSYTSAQTAGATGYYSVNGNSVEVHPSQDSYFEGHNALRVAFSGGKIQRIEQFDTGQEVANAEIEPELLTNLFDSTREKRRVVQFNEIPKVMLDAVLSAEDKRFFEHPGFDPVRILGAAWADLRHDARAQGASTITMQVSRSFFFSTQRTWKRKVAETMVSLELEHRFTKQQIFELYANEIYLGNRGSFAIHGFAEGSYAYFNKDMQNLTLGEAAFLAGIIRAPNRYSTVDLRPERADDARDRVLTQMVENRAATPSAAAAARKIPLHIASAALEGSAAPYFVDMVKDHLLNKFSESDLLSQDFRVYTTIDPDLQRAATEAVEIGMKNVDTQLAKRYAKWHKQGDDSRPQVALVAIDPRTGEIKAMVGGRDYGESQLNHALSMRQPGSAFKPFVYAAAFDNAVSGTEPILTTATTVDDSPTTFEFDGKDYTPNNYGEEFHGTVTLREALTFSLNVATVKVAEMVGYGRVAEFARQMGLASNIEPTPAMALGAYEMTPLEVAGGYTVFADRGVHADPMFIRSVRSSSGDVLESTQPRTRQALDPRVAYLVTSVLEDVVNRGTGYTVRARGFTAPAAGKTGTSRDGWFAGYTSNLECIVWVGFDDNRDLTLSGTNSAAPIWAEFMKRAVTFPAYSNTQAFAPPDGITTVTIDTNTLELATPSCPDTREEVYITGTEPTQFCNGTMTATPSDSWLSRVFGGSEQPKAPAGSAAGSAPGGQSPGTPSAQGDQQSDASKKKGLMRRIFGIFGPDKTPDSSPGKQGSGQSQPGANPPSN